MSYEKDLKKLMKITNSLLDKKIKLIKKGKLEEAQELDVKINIIIEEMRQLQLNKSKELEEKTKKSQDYLTEQLNSIGYYDYRDEDDFREIVKGK